LSLLDVKLLNVLAFFLYFVLETKRPFLCYLIMQALQIFVEEWYSSGIVQEPEMTTEVITVSWIKIYFVPASEI